MFPVNNDGRPLRRERKGKSLARVFTGLTPARQEIMDVLSGQAWFQATDVGLQLQLAHLPHDGPENCDGFLRDLAERPINIAGVTVLHMERLERGNFALTPIFRVVNVTGTEYTYEYVSWRYGPLSGAKGVVFVQDNDEITHFIVLRGQKFATGKYEWDTIGGFIDLNVEGVTNVLQRISKEIKEELGLSDLQITRVIDLGTCTVDAGMTNNRPSLFAAFIDGSEKRRVPVYPDNPDEFELRSGVVVFPISQLLSQLETNTDSYFRSTIACVIARGIVDIRRLV